VLGHAQGAAKIRWDTRARWHVLAIAAAALLLAMPSQAYYHYVHYLKGSYLPVPEAFDLNALPNRPSRFRKQRRFDRLWPQR